MSSSSEPDTPTKQQIDRARRAERARRRRAAAGATPRSHSQAALIRALDLNPNTVKSWKRRHRLRAERDLDVHPNAYPTGSDQVAPFSVLDRSITETHPVSYPSADQAGAPEYVPSETMADHLHRVAYLPGGRSLAFLAIVEGLFLNAAAARDEWAETDPELRALLAAE
ncbi:hypothetical protein [Methylobacterium sp. SI9]|uniref:hypothetical protein n=1 Tax=Methylobacterium guangdongense TaxID=3138811 RepID=UPI00313C8605